MKKEEFQKGSFLSLESTMQNIKSCLLITCVIYTSFVLLGTDIVLSKTDTDCLNHLGGGRSSYECFIYLSQDIGEESSILEKEILKTIPKNNNNLGVFKKYIKEEKKENPICNLYRQALYGWVEDKTANIKYQDVAYARCIYNEALSLNKKLKELLDNYKNP